MKVVASVTEGENTVEIVVPPASLVAYEVEHDEAVADAAATNRARWFAWLSWHALTLRHGETRPFEDWLNAVDDISDVTPKAGATRPTGPGPARTSASSAGSSPGPGSTLKRSSTSTPTSKRQSKAKST